MTRRFQDTVAIVTGAAGGIGAAIATRLHAEGASVVVADLKAHDAAVAAEKFVANGNGAAIGLACDVGQEQQVQAAVEATMLRFGRVDVIVNNAGLTTFKTLAEWTADDWLQVLRVDLLGAAFFTKQAFLHFGRKGGSIVNIASVHAIATSANAAPYSAAKAGLLSLTRTTAIEGRAVKIRANAVLPACWCSIVRSICCNVAVSSGRAPGSICTAR